MRRAYLDVVATHPADEVDRTECRYRFVACPTDRRSLIDAEIFVGTVLIQTPRRCDRSYAGCNKKVDHPINSVFFWRQNMTIYKNAPLKR